jgi:hypothetical protein
MNGHAYLDAWLLQEKIFQAVGKKNPAALPCKSSSSVTNDHVEETAAGRAGKKSGNSGAPSPRITG